MLQDNILKILFFFLKTNLQWTFDFHKHKSEEKQQMWIIGTMTEKNPTHLNRNNEKLLSVNFLSKKMTFFFFLNVGI